MSAGETRGNACYAGLGMCAVGGGGTQTSFHGKTCHVAKLALVNLTLTRFNL